MKNHKIFIALLFAISFSSFAKTQDQSTLYSISGNGLKETSYLFGTLHLQCTEDFIIKDKVKKAFDECDQVYFEIDIDDPIVMNSITSSIQTDKKLSEKLNYKNYIALDSLVQQKLGYPLIALDNYSLSIVAGLITLTVIECENQSSYELVLLEMAHKKELEIKGLESVEFQLDCLEKGSNEEITLKHIFDKEYYNLVKDMLAAYKNEDLHALENAMKNEIFMSTEEIKWILEIRNKNWLEKMPKIMKEKSTFFAVGAGHLIYDVGVINGLRKAGFTVTPIMN